MCRSASPALKIVHLIVILDAADLIAGMGGQDITRRLLDVFLLNTKLGGFISRRRNGNEDVSS